MARTQSSSTSARRGNGGGFAFGPAAVRVDPGTTVRWEWTGEGGTHNVVATDDAYGSDLLSDPGETFEHSFDSDGVSLYVCGPHEAMGMKGAVVVGDADIGAGTADLEYVAREPGYDGWFDETAGFQGTVDWRGREEVRIGVGATADGVAAFSPPAVHVDPGTRVIWEWAGGDATHAVVADDDSYASPDRSSGSWGLVFDGTGISKYASAAAPDAMRGVVVVGDVFGSVHDVTTRQLTLLGAVGMGLLSPLAFGVFLWLRGRDTPPDAGDVAKPRPGT
ncbi:halocyanin domain-containing protein [Halobacterium bonnevillei]|uniref:Halocyanin domain-containing protein n=2 Tax=Halobacterium bonnevillei TaxID=2692200 RepID=A0A6B0SKU6_9EURY|nr:halocyanin domain-containing protein [Halobacterium bonnevillei]MXR22275.1 halocyanin domain-containing protein [Halobacterium bonnevillei]